jgi:adenylate kinase family enzyme
MAKKAEVQLTTKPTFLGITGPAACGKSTLLKLLYASVVPRQYGPSSRLKMSHVFAMDSSELMKWRMEKFTDKVSQDLRNDVINRNQGGLTPDLLAIQPLATWLNLEQNRSQNVFMAGFPRSNFQAGFLNSTFGDGILIVLIECTPTETFRWVADRRQKAKDRGQEGRPDDQQAETVITRIRESLFMAENLKRAHSSHLITIHRNASLLNNLRLIHQHLPEGFDPCVRQRMASKLMDGGPVAETVAQIENQSTERAELAFKHFFPKEFEMAQDGTLNEYVLSRCRESDTPVVPLNPVLPPGALNALITGASTKSPPQIAHA